MKKISLGKYELVEKIGKGGYGTVYRALDTGLDIERAIKVLHPQLVMDTEYINRFRNEAKTAVHLDHRNIVPIYDLGEDEGYFFIVMKLMTNGSLRDYLRNSNDFSISEVLEILQQTAAALDYIHTQGITHCDLKPDNLLIAQDGSICLVDFGFALAGHNSTSTSGSMSKGIFGTPTYMAPEQLDIERVKEIGPATDLYALGIIAYELLAGKPPFEGDSTSVMAAHLFKQPPSLSGVLPSFSPAADLFLQRMLSKDPADRPQPASEFVKRLSTLLLPKNTQPERTPPAVAEETPQLDAEMVFLPGKEYLTLPKPIPLRSNGTADTVWTLAYAMQQDQKEAITQLYSGNLEVGLKGILTPETLATFDYIQKTEPNRDVGVNQFMVYFFTALIKDGVRLSRLAINDRNWHKADYLTDQILRLEPAHGEAYSLRGEILEGVLADARQAWKAQDFDATQTYAAQALRINKQEVEAEYLFNQSRLEGTLEKARNARRTRDYQQAINYADTILGWHPDHAEATVLKEQAEKSLISTEKWRNLMWRIVSAVSTLVVTLIVGTLISFSALNMQERALSSVGGVVLFTLSILPITALGVITLWFLDQILKEKEVWFDDILPYIGYGVMLLFAIFTPLLAAKLGQMAYLRVEEWNFLNGLVRWIITILTMGIGYFGGYFLGMIIIEEF